MSFPNDEKKCLSPIPSPCKNCPEQADHCHGKCEKYAAFRAKIDALAEERKHDRDYNEYLADMMKRFPGKRSL